MSHLRTVYHTIRFPIVDTRPEFMLATYRSEFGIGEPLDETDAITVFSHALRDYLIGNLSESSFGSICFALVTTPKLDGLLKYSLPDLHSVIWDCVDIAWLAGSKHFGSFKANLARVLKTLSDGSIVIPM